MKSSKKTKSDLNKKLQKVLQTPASFDFFVAIHDFIKHIESNPSLLNVLSHRIKVNKELNIPNKYAFLRQIYQGLEDINIKSDTDLGHSRYLVMRELKQIQNGEFSESNIFWRKRELSRKLANLVYGRLDTYLSES